MSLIEKIDAEIKESDQYGCEGEYRAGLYKAKEIILSQQKEPIGNTEQLTIRGFTKEESESYYKAMDNIYKPVVNMKIPLTIGDKIRESNESLAELILNFGDTCNHCSVKNTKGGCRRTGCSKGIKEFLDQPYTDSKLN